MPSHSHTPHLYHSSPPSVQVLLTVGLPADVVQGESQVMGQLRQALGSSSAVMPPDRMLAAASRSAAPSPSVPEGSGDGGGGAGAGPVGGGGNKSTRRAALRRGPKATEEADPTVAVDAPGAPEGGSCPPLEAGSGGGGGVAHAVPDPEAVSPMEGVPDDGKARPDRLQQQQQPLRPYQEGGDEMGETQHEPDQQQNRWEAEEPGHEQEDYAAYGSFRKQLTGQLGHEGDGWPQFHEEEEDSEGGTLSGPHPGRPPLHPPQHKQQLHQIHNLPQHRQQGQRASGQFISPRYSEQLMAESPRPGPPDEEDEDDDGDHLPLVGGFKPLQQQQRMMPLDGQTEAEGEDTLDSVCDWAAEDAAHEHMHTARDEGDRQQIDGEFSLAGPRREVEETGEGEEEGEGEARQEWVDSPTPSLQRDGAPQANQAEEDEAPQVSSAWEPSFAGPAQEQVASPVAVMLTPRRASLRDRLAGQRAPPEGFGGEERVASEAGKASDGSEAVPPSPSSPSGDAAAPLQAGSSSGDEHAAKEMPENPKQEGIGAPPVTGKMIEAALPVKQQPQQQTVAAAAAAMPLYTALAAQLCSHKQQISAAFGRSVFLGEEALLDDSQESPMHSSISRQVLP